MIALALAGGSAVSLRHIIARMATGVTSRDSACLADRAVCGITSFNSARCECDA